VDIWSKETQFGVRLSHPGDSHPDPLFIFYPDVYRTTFIREIKIHPLAALTAVHSRPATEWEKLDGYEVGLELKVGKRASSSVAIDSRLGESFYLSRRSRDTDWEVMP
jgi:hypothetical protein